MVVAWRQQELVNWDMKGGGDVEQAVEEQTVFSVLDLNVERPIEPALVCELFLRKPGLRSELPQP